MLSGLKSFVLWDYARGSWQYDVMVGLILAFIFLTPRAWFRDQPRTPAAARITTLPATNGSQVFWVEPELLSSIPENERLARLGEMLKTQTHKTQTVTRLEPIYDSEQEVKGYMAFVKP